jgi:hypothetical protein
MEKTIDPVTLAPARPIVYYPESDGKPIGETDFHINTILYLRQALRHFSRLAEQVYVAANMLFYYEEGNPSAVTSPDVFVVKGIAKHDRRTYKLWEERVAPCVIFEITSRSSRLDDLGTKRELYEMLGVLNWSNGDARRVKQEHDECVRALAHHLAGIKSVMLAN